MNKGNKLAKNTLVLSMCTLLNKGLMFLVLPFFTRWLTLEDYGTYDVLSTYISLLIPICSLAASNAIFRLSVESTMKAKREYISSGLLLYIVNAIVMVSALVLVHSLFTITAFIPFLLLLIGELADNYFQGYLRALKKLSLYGICKMITVVSSVIAIVVFVRFLNCGLYGLLIGYAIGCYISSCFIVIKTKFWTYFSIRTCSLKKIKEIISYSWALIPNDISWWIINVSDRQIINLFLGPSFNGVYAISNKIPNLCSSVFGVFNVSWQESATEALKDNDRINYYNTTLNKILSLLLSLSTCIVACNFLFFDYIFDVRYSNARFYAPILVASTIFSTIAIFYGGIQISLKKPKANGLSTIIGAVVNLVTHFLLINYIGLFAAAISTLIANFIVMLVRILMLKKDLSLKIENKIYIYVLGFLYFAICGMFKTGIIFSLINLLLSLFVFVFINKSDLLRLKKKVFGK